MTRLPVQFAVFVTLLMACTAHVRAGNPATAAASEQRVKAGYVYNFAKLVEWPASRSNGPLVIGVLGNDEFATVLSRMVAGKKIDDRQLIVKRIRSSEVGACGCRMLFLAASESGRADAVIELQKAGSVLTIAESADFARRGGIVALTMKDTGVRFAINVDAASQASLTISSRLLALATIVHTPR